MKVLITDAGYSSLDIEADVLVKAGYELVVASCRTPQEVIEAAAGVDALLVQFAPITVDVFEALPQLRLVSRYGVGVDVVDTEAARDHGVWVCNVPDYGTTEVALHAVAMLLALLRNVAGHDREVRAGHWDYHLGGQLRRPSSLTFGVVGLGRIGRMTAERAAPWFGAAAGYDPYVAGSDWPKGVERLSLEDLFARSSAITLHLPLNESTRGLVGADLLGRMPSGSYLVNTARGGLVDLDALVEALDSGKLAGAALDVLPEEPPPQDHPLLTHPRALITPHVAWYSAEAEVELRRKAAQNIVDWRQTGRPTYAVVEGR
jgi:D-3-phosphoglycerate dehydrogenase / 2-oxoglutarate reductase